MKVLMLILAMVFCCSTVVDGQVYDRRGQTIYVEGGGAAIAYSINYETRFSEKTEGLGGRIGFSYLNDWIAIPVNVNILLGKKDKSHFLELGAGITYFKYAETELLGGRMGDSQVLAAFSIMYRIHPRYGKWMFRIGITPLVGRILDEEEDGISSLPWIGVSLGRAF